jgi:hypothetical protein
VLKNTYSLTHLRDEVEDPDLATGNPMYKNRVTLGNIQGTVVNGLEQE